MPMGKSLPFFSSAEGLWVVAERARARGSLSRDDVVFVRDALPAALESFRITLPKTIRHPGGSRGRSDSILRLRPAVRAGQADRSRAPVAIRPAGECRHGSLVARRRPVTRPPRRTRRPLDGWTNRSMSEWASHYFECGYAQRWAFCR